jgi:hypothetical protein
MRALINVFIIGCGEISILRKKNVIISLENHYNNMQ